ncbi:MAG TPA: double-strand break repair protein AddB [Pseudolabrys sp.]|nr:double-strand break repair protein AddB [Pseudolabrys sp.]
MPAAKPNVFNIPASARFLPVLIDALLGGKLVPGFPTTRDPLELAQATLYLPTRRAVRLARDVFLERIGTDAAILPRILAVGDIDEDEFAFAEAATAGLAAAALDLPPAIPTLERRLLLAELILKWANSAALRGAEGSPLIANTPSAALGLADDLARLIDDMTTRQVSWDRLDGLVPDALDPYWQLSLEFLKIARGSWPALLAERGAIETAERRDRLIEAEAQRLASSKAPVIAAGSTGSMPATAKLLATIARLPHGALVLPGLDMDLDEASWAAIAGNSDDKSHNGEPSWGHAQFAMRALLATLGIERREVAQLARAQGRERVVSEALRPAATTDHWRQRAGSDAFAEAADAAMASMTMIEAANAEEEALAIAVALREALETPGKTAALATPDRALARRVASALERWQVTFDDSAGVALADMPAGIFARLAAEAALGGLEPVTLLALLKHPLLRLDAAKDAHAMTIATLEQTVLRGPRPRPGSEGLDRAFAAFRLNRDALHRNDPRWLIADDRFDGTAELIGRLAAALAPLEDVKKRHPLAELARRHREVIVALSRDNKGAAAAFAGPDGLKLEQALEELAASPSAAGLAVAKGDYAELFHASISGRMVRRPERANVRVHIFGLLEARLQSVDRVVLGGLNEGTWPGETRSDPWLSRPMRAALGLDPPERRIGLSAHDFAQALGAGEVVLARAQKVAGAPAVTSRFVQRLAAVAGDARWQAAIARGEHYLAWARALDAAERVTPAARPAPVPPPDARPDRLSVTDIENWLRDPYTIYAKHVLRLFPLEPVDTLPGAAERGSIIHEAIGEFTKTYSATGLPADPESELIRFGEKSFAPWQDFPEARALWWPRFKRIANWFAAWERQRRPGLATVHGEIKGELKIPLQARTFTLSARADRIEQRADGSYAILDYKTGQPPTTPQVQSGLAPQLTLEAAILRGGGFENVAAGPVVQVSYVRLKGGEPPAKQEDIKFKDRTPDTVAADALTKLTGIATRFLLEGEPYRSLVHPMWARHYGDYDHLARVKEWAASGGESEYEGPPS